MKYFQSAIRLGMALMVAAVAVAAPLPERPEGIVFQPLQFDPPHPADYRQELASGVPVYLAPSAELPLVTITLSFNGGDYLDDPRSVGLARMTAAMMRRGGTAERSAEELDERFDFLAANVMVGSGGTQSVATLNTLTSTLDEAFALFMEMVRTPGFQEDKIGVYRAEALEQMKQRNDDAQNILNREWASLMFGEDHFEARQPTERNINSITRDDLRAFHAKVFQPGNLMIGVTGDFDPRAMLDRLERAVSGWERGERMPDPPAPAAPERVGVYHVEKDIPQGKVNIGHRGVTRDHPDFIPLMVMNDILGGGGFTSRLVSRVRSDEGLAYSVGSGLSTPVWYPGQFRASFQSKNSTVALAAKIIMEEINRIRTEPVSAQELETSKNSFIETFPRRFESRQAIIGTFIDDEWTGRDRDYWETYREKVNAVTAEDVLRVAKEHLRPDRVVIMVVGNWSEIAPGDLEGRASMKDFFGGAVMRMPLRDPMTLEPIN